MIRLSKSIATISIIVCCVLSYAYAQSTTEIDFGEKQPLTIITKNGEFNFSVEVADTEEKRARGLMFRENMPPNEGMLFDFGEVRPIAMWMQNTVLSLDMIFLGPNGTVKRIARNTVPYSRDIITSGEPVSHVLELNAGISLQIGLESGDLVKHSLLSVKNEQ